MILVKLKDNSITEIADSLKYYTVFAGTFCDNDETEIYSLKFTLDNGVEISFDSHQESYFDSPIGFVNPSALIINILNLVAEKESDKMTTAEFVEWCSQYSTGFKLSVFIPGEGTKTYPRWTKNYWSSAISFSEFMERENIKFSQEEKQQ